ncbi:MAG TPA: Uma2 family endonuclease, partial [Pirellulales bacterium]
MSINALTLSTSRHAEPTRRRWTGDEYRRIAELGLFRGQKVELLDGEVFQQHGDREPDRRRWTREEYQQIAALGLFEGQRVERLDGEIVQHMSPQGAAHAQAVSKSLIALMRVFASGFVVRSQMPLALGLSADPEPDLAVVPGHPDDYDEHPTTALLV